MTNEQMKDFVRKLMQPVFDKMVDQVVQTGFLIEKSFPAEMPRDQRIEIFKTILKSHNDTLIKQMDLPPDMEGKIKEAMNGRRS